ncbi:macrolide family glycosyltransferase [Actinopolymorpha sp. NPDC004070]|uniref:macrolide family glycosyltransferase n=1 Tax=Actinopolymorpha sp. NPDC004070 TaxID=3154548 RepID=UPI0033B22F77
MSRITMTGMPASGHVNPSLPLVRELVGRGVGVTYYATGEFAEPVERAGAKFRAYPDGAISSRDIAAATQSGSSVRVVARVLAATLSLVPFLREEFARERPDAVVYDSNALWGRVTAASLRLPTISFMTTMLVGPADFKGLTALEWAHTLRLMLPDFPEAVRARRRVLRRFGKDVVPSTPMLPMFGDLTLFPIPREIQPANSRLDESCHFLGPTVNPVNAGLRGAELDAELAAHVDGAEPVVLVSLGTLHAGTGEFFRTCLSALADLPVRVVLAVGHSTDPAELGSPPANTLVRTTVPQVEILRRAAVFVTHGGMNSALEALTCGVPLVVVPQQVEQLLIGRTIAERGAAVVLRQHLSHRPVPPGDLRTAVERMLTDPSARGRARALGAGFGAGGGAGGAELVEKFLRRQRKGGS